MNIWCGNTPRLRLIWTLSAPALSAAAMIRSVTSTAAPTRHLPGLPLDIGHGQAPEILTGELGGAAVSGLT
jgi:hypothetical protein